METRIFRSPQGNYCKDDILGAFDIYDDACLAELKANGFNAICLKAILRNVSKTNVFPELGADAEKYQNALNLLCDRTGKHGIKVYLHFDEPLAFPKDDPFWTEFPELKGQPGSSPMDGMDSTFAVCTSHTPSMEFLYYGMENIFCSCPDLGGAVLATRSRSKLLLVMPSGRRTFSSRYSAKGCPERSSRM